MTPINLSPRDYQQKIFETAKDHNTLVVLPTGLGKTLIALLLSIHRLKSFPTSKILFLAPTRPLAEQHYQTFQKQLPELFADLQLFTGSVPASKRKQIFQTAEIIFSTPQCIANDLNSHLYDLKNVSLLIIDEAHRCLKNYDYTKVVDFYKRQSLHQRILGLTASPGSAQENVKEICKHLDVSEIEVRTRESEDVKPYIQELEFDRVVVPFPSEFQEIKILLKKIYDKQIEQLRHRNLLFGPANKVSLLALQGKLASQISRRNFNAMIGMGLTATAIKLSHALELLETQTLSGLNEYLQSLLKQAKEKKSKAVQRLVKEKEFNAALISLQHLLAKKIEHPKIEETAVLVENQFKEKSDSKIIVFTQFRETGVKIAKRLNEISGVRARVFFGQAKKNNTGLSQKEQKAIIEKLNQGEINVLVATSVHPDEYIVLKKDRRVYLEKIGEFIDRIITKRAKKPTQSKRIEGYEVLTSDGKKVFFAPVTCVHRHTSKNNCYDIKLSSGLNTLVTKDHSLFSFGPSSDFQPSNPEINKFVSLVNKCPNIETTKQIDIIEEIKENFNGLYGSIVGLNQAMIRQLKTDFEVLYMIRDKKRSLSDLSRIVNREYPTISKCLERALKQKFISQKTGKQNRKISFLTQSGKEYLGFLHWFFRNVRYSKGKYKFQLKINSSNNKTFGKFLEQRINIKYGKQPFSRFLYLNKYVARFLGFYVSEGSTRRTKSTSDIFLAARDKKMQKLMKESVEKGLKLKTRKNWRGIAVDSQIGYHLIKYVFKAGVGAYNKEVPESILTSPSKIKWEFLRAYTLGDGHVREDRVTLTTVSKKLVTGLVLLLRMLGIRKITLGRQGNIYRLNIFESLPFAQIKEKSKNMGKTYYALKPRAYGSAKYFGKYGNYFKKDYKSSGRCREVGEWKEGLCFDYIKEMKKLAAQPKFVYDLSVKGTENFFGGTGLVCLHNSIGEEGLDIAEVSTVIFYEPIPSAIRKIQRAGRTARLKPGKLIILITKDTRDVPYHYASRAREKKMYKILDSVKEELKNGKKTKILDDFK